MNFEKQTLDLFEAYSYLLFEFINSYLLKRVIEINETKIIHKLPPKNVLITIEKCVSNHLTEFFLNNYQIM